MVCEAGKEGGREGGKSVVKSRVLKDKKERGRREKMECKAGRQAAVQCS